MTRQQPNALDRSTAPNTADAFHTSPETYREPYGCGGYNEDGKPCPCGDDGGCAESGECCACLAPGGKPSNNDIPPHLLPLVPRPEDTPEPPNALKCGWIRNGRYRNHCIGRRALSNGGRHE